MEEDYQVPSYSSYYVRTYIQEHYCLSESPLVPTDERRRMREPFMAPSADSLRANNVAGQIRSISHPETRRRVEEAIAGAGERGVEIVGLFRDLSNHIHLSIPTGGRM